MGSKDRIIRLEVLMHNTSGIYNNVRIKDKRLSIQKDKDLKTLTFEISDLTDTGERVCFSRLESSTHITKKFNSLKREILDTIKGADFRLYYTSDFESIFSKAYKIMRG